MTKVERGLSPDFADVERGVVIAGVRRRHQRLRDYGPHAWAGGYVSGISRARNFGEKNGAKAVVARR